MRIYEQVEKVIFLDLQNYVTLEPFAALHQFKKCVYHQLKILKIWIEIINEMGKKKHF